MSTWTKRLKNSIKNVHYSLIDNVFKANPADAHLCIGNNGTIDAYTIQATLPPVVSTDIAAFTNCSLTPLAEVKVIAPNPN